MFANGTIPVTSFSLLSLPLLRGPKSCKCLSFSLLSISPPLLWTKVLYIFIGTAGDVMGPALTGLDNLIRLPTGCGEQNMLNFAPNIFVLQYLNETQQTSVAIKEKALKYMQTGD